MGPYEIADRLEIEVLRGLTRSGATEPLERAEALVVLADRIAARRDAAMVAAADDPQSPRAYAALAAVAGVSRQALRQRVARRR